MVSFYAWTMCLQLAVGNVITFAYLLYFYKQKLDLYNKEAIQQPPAKMSQEKFEGIFELPIFDGVHTPQNVSLYAYGIGLVSGLGLSIFTFPSSYSFFGFYLFALGLFHEMEYVITAKYHEDVGLIAFLLNHSREYHIAAIACVVEYWVEWLFLGSWKSWNLIQYLGVFGVIVSQALRSTAMITAGSNFTHLVAYEKEDKHKLVTGGIYSIFRHPSYTGFFYWGIFAQVCLMNPICLVAYALALHRFFAARIPDEEKALIEFFGSDYIEFKKRTFVFIPGIE